MDQNELKQIIFNGHFEGFFSCLEFTVCLSSLDAKDSQEIAVKTSFVKNKQDNICFIVDLLSRSIKSINGDKFENRNELKSKLWKCSNSLIFVLYDCYRQLIDGLSTDIQTSFDKFVETHESKKRWELFKLGYKFSDHLSALQESWIYWNVQNDKKESFDKQFSLAKYISHRIGHAVVNPKSYVQTLKTENNMQKTEQDENLDLSNHQDLSKSVFEKLVSKKKESDNKGAKEVWNKAIESQDNHDEFVREQEIIRFKNAIRRRKLSRFVSKKPTAVINPNINVGYVQESYLDSEEANKINESNPYIINGMNYKDILTSKAAADIKNKMDIFHEVINEEYSSKILEEEGKYNINSFGESKAVQEPSEEIIRHKHKIEKKDEDTQPRKTIRELMFEKGINVQDLNQMKLNELRSELDG